MQTNNDVDVLGVVSMPKKTHRLANLFLILLTLFVLVGGYWWYTTQYVKNSVISEQDVVRYYNAYTINDVDTVIVEAQRLQHANPNDYLGYLMLAAAYIQKGIRDADEMLYGNLAYDEVQKAILLAPDSPDAYRILAQAHELRMEMKEALAAYNKALTLDPEDYLTLGLRGHLYYLMGNLALAERDYKAVLRIEPEYARTLTDLAMLYMLKGESGVNVEEILLRAIALEKSHADLSRTHNALGSYYLNLGRYDEAIATYKNAEAYDPSMVPALNGIAMANFYLLERDGFDDMVVFEDRLVMASEYVNRTLEQDSDFARGYLTLGFLLNVLGSYDDEKKAYEDGLIALETDNTMTQIGKDELQLIFTNLLKQF